MRNCTSYAGGSVVAVTPTSVLSVPPEAEVDAVVSVFVEQPPAASSTAQQATGARAIYGRITTPRRSCQPRGVGYPASAVPSASPQSPCLVSPAVSLLTPSGNATGARHGHQGPALMAQAKIT